VGQTRFVVLCASSLLPAFKAREGYAGAVYLERKLTEEHVALCEVPGDVRTLLVQNHPSFIEHVSRHEESVARLDVLVFNAGTPHTVRPWPGSSAPGPSVDLATALATPGWLEGTKAENLRSLKEDLFEQRAFATGLPIRLWLESTTRCNFRCRMCYNTTAPASFGQDMADETFDAVRNALFPVLTAVDMQGQGEPLLARRFDDFYAEAVRFGVRPAMVTNGSLLTHGRIDAFVRDGVQLIISLDGTTPDTYGVMRPGYAVGKLLDQIDYACQRRDAGGATRFSVNLLCLVTKPSARGVPELVRRAVGWKVGFIVLMNLDPWHMSEAEVAELLIDPARDRDEMDALLEAQRLAAAHGVFFSMPFRVPDGSAAALDVRQPALFARIRDRFKPGNTRYPGVCTMPWSHAWISRNGTVRVCCVLTRSMGNITRQPFADIWNGPAYRELRASLNGPNPPEECRRCTQNFGINGTVQGLPEGLTDD
jgi:MoaA/NifB/PqqE/SkfB family radical SAM enzyme